MPSTFAIGLDFGTNSARGMVVDVGTGEVVATSVFEYPDGEWLASLHLELERIRKSFGEEACDFSSSAGLLSSEWASRLGLPVGITIAIGGFDAHLGVIGASIDEGTLVKVIGTSTCDIMIAADDGTTLDISGLYRIVSGSVLPGHIGSEVGQSAVGDIYNWFVSTICGGSPDCKHEILTEQASKLAVGQSGLLTLDWRNGNRTRPIFNELASKHVLRKHGIDAYYGQKS